MAVKKLGASVIFGTPPSLEIMQTVLERNELETLIKGVRTSTLIDDYRKYRSFQIVAKKNEIHRPDVRRALSQVSKTLLEKTDEASLALGAFVYGLIDKASASGQGYSKRKLDKISYLFKEDPNILGSFYIDVKDPAFEQILVSRANH